MITFIPAGGLGNRMRAIAAAMKLAQTTQNPLEIIWFQDWGLGCRFDQLFQPFNDAQTRLREATWLDLLTRDIPRKRNFHLPRLFEKWHYDACLDRLAASNAYYNDFDFFGWSKGRNVWLASDVYFIDQKLFRGLPLNDMFKPIEKLQKRIEQTKSLFGKRTVGVHIRRTDHTFSIENSPTYLFVERMKQEPETTTFYLASDSEEVKRELQEVFGNRLITSPNEAERGSVEGMQDALVEMHLLAATRRILGSSCSTYSITAADIGEISLEIIEKNEDRNRNNMV